MENIIPYLNLDSWHYLPSPLPDQRWQRVKWKQFQCSHLHLCCPCKKKWELNQVATGSFEDYVIGHKSHNALKITSLDTNPIMLWGKHNDVIYVQLQNALKQVGSACFEASIMTSFTYSSRMLWSKLVQHSWKFIVEFESRSLFPQKYWCTKNFGIN